MRQAGLFLAEPTATFSACARHAAGDSGCAPACVGRPYRYTLSYPASIAGQHSVLFLLANPSTATHLRPDPTVSRCIGYATDWGFSRCLVGNARAFRSTDPEGVPPDPEGIGPENDRHLRELVRSAALVVCGWGTLGGARGPAVLSLIRSEGKVPYALHTNQDGTPGHPLYLAKDRRPFPLE